MVDKGELESLCRRRGFIWQSSEIYGGEAGFYDYGHLGSKLKDNWEREWKNYFLGLHENYHMIYTPNVLPYRVLDASGHVDHFSDVLIKCNRCGSSFRGDHIIEEVTGENAEWMGTEDVESKVLELDIKCPDCGGEFGDPIDFNMMFSVDIGPKGDRKGFLRPETAQGTYINFKREYRANRKKMPLGLATIGTAFRNEISPRQGVYRLREFIQAELQIFFVPRLHDDVFEEEYEELDDVLLNVKRADWNEAKEVNVSELEDLDTFYLLHLVKMYEFYTSVMGLNKEDVRSRELSEDEKAFYNKIHFDIEVNFDSLDGWKEVSGLHYRSDYDLQKHENESGEKMSIPTDEGRKIPHVLELSFGLDRNIWALLDRGYHLEDKNWFEVPDKLAPYQVAVFPLVRKDELPEKSREVFNLLRDDFRAKWEKSGSIGKRYARNDEIGTSYCLTIDYDTMDDDTLTIRDIDTKEQIRVHIDELKEVLNNLVEGKKEFEEYME
ncbi:MAG: glycine--tRNA ligase [Thermoplasmatota archaeon]